MRNHGEEAKEDDEEPLAMPLDNKPADPLAAAADPDEEGDPDEEDEDDDEEDEEEDDEADEYLNKFVNKGREVN